MRVPRFVLPLLSALTLACGTGDRAGSAPDGDPAPEPSVGSGPFVAFPAAGVASSNPDTVPDPGIVRERGIGVLGFDPGPQLAGRIADSIEVWADSTPAAAVIARMVLDTTGVFRFEAREGLLERPGALDYGYQEVGLVVLERRGEWLRVFLGNGADGAGVSGWSRARERVSALTLWEDLLPGLPLFFAVPPDSMGFHAVADGPEVQFPIGDGYIMRSLTVDGDWMRVRVVSPSDYCATPAALREDTLWIRWRGASGNPRVWFHTRGC